MLFYVEKKSTQEQIYNFAKEVGAKWIVVKTDHYRGNNKGYYQSVEQFKDSKVFNWNKNPEDRGATSVYVTDIDIPAAVAARFEMQCEIARLDAGVLSFLNNIDDSHPIPKLDKRWGVNNPKRLAVEAKKEERRKAIENVYADHDKKVAEIKSRMISTNFVSSSYIELSL